MNATNMKHFKKRISLKVPFELSSWPHLLLLLLLERPFSLVLLLLRTHLHIHALPPFVLAVTQHIHDSYLRVHIRAYFPRFPGPRIRLFPLLFSLDPLFSALALSHSARWSPSCAEERKDIHLFEATAFGLE